MTPSQPTTHAERDTETPEQALAHPGGTESSTSLVLATPPPYLAGLTIFANTDELILKTIERTMAAETPEELLADPESGGLRDYTGKVIEITDVLGIMPSSIREGSYYIIFEAATPPDGEVVTLSTGSPFAASRIAKLSAKGWLPRTVRVMELESAQNPGQSSLWIVDPPKGAVRPGESPF